MTIFRTPFDTLGGSSIALPKTQQAINESIVQDYIQMSGSYNLKQYPEMNVFLVTGQHKTESFIPFFTQPMPIYKNDRIANYVMDVRPFISPKQEDGVSDVYSLKARNSQELHLAINRLICSVGWIKDSPGILKDLSPVPMAIYCSWISENISRRFALDAREQLIIAVIAGFFYLTLFKQEDDFTDSERIRVVAAVSKATKVPTSTVQSIAAEITAMSGLQDLCKQIKEAVGNPRIQDLDPGLLITTIGGTWFGTDAKLLTAIALEYPPAWIPLVHAALNERGYKNSTIANIALRYHGKKGGDDFNRAFKGYVEQYLN